MVSIILPSSFKLQEKKFTTTRHSILWGVSFLSKQVSQTLNSISMGLFMDLKMLPVALGKQPCEAALEHCLCGLVICW